MQRGPYWQTLNKLNLKTHHLKARQELKQPRNTSVSSRRRRLQHPLSSDRPLVKYGAGS